MCVNCGILSDLFRARVQYPTIGSQRVYQLLKDMLQHGRLELYTEATCSFEELADSLTQGQISSYTFYFNCPKCGSCFLFRIEPDGKTKYGPISEVPQKLR